jgi:hypothetical protein
VGRIACIGIYYLSLLTVKSSFFKMDEQLSALRLGEEIDEDQVATSNGGLDKHKLEKLLKLMKAMMIIKVS